MKVVGQKLIDVPYTIYKKLDSLNLRQSGEMRRTLRRLRSDKNDNTFVHYIIEGDKLVGWVMSVKVKGCYEDLTGYFNHFYVRKNSRKKGYGEALLTAAYTYCVRKNEKCVVSPWDANSSAFFDRVSRIFNLQLVYRDVFSLYIV